MHAVYETLVQRLEEGNSTGHCDLSALKLAELPAIISQYPNIITLNGKNRSVKRVEYSHAQR
ncbi:MAG: hypothetical protein RBT80_18855 [Candidatus Vecturithrix sp.]|nr:hypothetical protein [Candidatus Vecturithrix sp.]